MGFLHKLWDETLAGPTPDSGLGGLRKYDSFPSSRSSAARRSAPPPSAAGALSHPDLPAVTRSITIVRTTPALRSISGDPGSGPSTPSTPSTPGTPDGKLKKFTRRKPPSDGSDGAQPRGPTDYDWIVFSGLDR
ncbi:hypothetical protein ACJRO7_035648 [Eucalyptus globulus]|uniref:Dormancy-associated protein homolog 4 n=1 Tax=Eucalyptus globulus TaxID=34317 RepID=A0ABD3J9P4_EUCGL